MNTADSGPSGFAQMAKQLLSRQPPPLRATPSRGQVRAVQRVKLSPRERTRRRPNGCQLAFLYAVRQTTFPTLQVPTSFTKVGTDTTRTTR